MKKIFFTILSAILFSGILSLLAGGCATPVLDKKDLAAPAPEVTILYPEWKYKAVTFSYDDGTIEDRKLTALFNRYGLKATFNVSSRKTGETRPRNIKKTEMKELYKGHEIASHGKTHLPMAKQTPEKIQSEIADDIAVLGKIATYPIRGFAYPYGSYSNEVIRILKKNGIEYARCVGSSRKFTIPGDFMRWRATAHHNNNISALADKFLALPEKELSLFYIWGHAYEFDRQKTWGMMENFCQKISRKKNIYYATNIEICDYLKSIKKMAFNHGKRSGKNNSALPLYLVVNGEKVKLLPGESYIYKQGKILIFQEK